MENRDIRAFAIANGVKLWEVAEALGIADTSFSRKLRHELSQDEKERIFEIVRQIAGERECGIITTKASPASLGVYEKEG